jgi:hypothetical protein
MKLNPELVGKFVGVCGSVENRHGIILAKSENAKKLGVKTGMTVIEAKRLCPELELVEAKHNHYLAYSKLVKNIYRDYTDKIESFGIDECWLDVTGSLKMFGSGEEIADIIRKRVREELGLTVSVACFLKLWFIDNLYNEISLNVAIIVSLVLLLAIMMAKLVGCILPLIAKKCKLDPAVVASPFMTTIVDVLTLVIYCTISISLLV